MEEDCRYKENLDGYENKLRIEDTITLKEEKKEKKHKKEKKDREKREGKEKKDKDRDDGKDKEKRDKKEKHKKDKHRDKKKKDKDKDKEKGSNAETSGAAASASASASVLGTKIDDKLGATKERGNGTFFASNEKNGFSRRQNGDENIPVPRNNNNQLISQGMEDSNFVLELARRINDDEKVTHHNQFLDKKEESRFVQELGRRFNDEEQVTTNQLDRFSAAAGKKKIDDGELYTLVKSPGDFVVDKKGKDRHIGFKTMDGKGVVKFGENSMVQTFTGTAKSSIGELPGTTQGKEKPKENDDKSRKKHKSKDGEKKSHSKKDKDMEKEKKKAKKKKHDKSDTEPLTQEGRRNGPDDVSINAGMTYPVVSKVMSSVPLSDDQRNNAIADGTEKRSKELDTNGPLNSCSAGRSYPVGFEVIGSFPLSDQRNNATVEGTEKPRNGMDVNGPVNSSNASSFTEVMGSNSTPLSGQKNHAVVRRNEKKKQKEIDTNGPEIIRTATKNYSVGIPELVGSAPLSDFQNHPIVIGNAKKRNDIDIDGFRYDNEARTNKVPRLSPPLNSLENGRKLEAHQSVKVLTSEKHDGGSARSLQMDNNKEQQQQEQKKNGLIDAKSLHILGPNPAAVLSDQIIERPRKTKPPHPDTEFLSQILTVPKMDEWNGFDDQEWLLCGQEPPPSRKPPEMCSAGVSEDLQVWSEALNIEPMDIVAFPYVLPY